MESLYAAAAYFYLKFQNHPYPSRFMLYVYRTVVYIICNVRIRPVCVMVYIICVLPDAFSTELYPIFVDNVNKSVDNPQLSTILLFISILKLDIYLFLYQLMFHVKHIIIHLSNIDQFL